MEFSKISSNDGLRSDSPETAACPTGRASTTRSQAPKHRQDNIDLLRAIAIVAVILYHYTTRFPVDFYQATAMPFTFAWGRHGVDLFFTVSGFCIFMTLDSSKSLENFWARRIARIQPAYMTAIVITAATLMIVELPGRTTSWPIALSNMLWLNIIPHWPQVDGAYWSLVVELKFYFLIGLIYYGMRGCNISLAWLVVCIAGAAARFTGPYAAYTDNILISDFAPSFLAGILAWEWPRLHRPHAFALAACTCILLLITPRFDDAWLLGLFLGIGAFVILRMSWLKVPKAITFIGLISYSMYLLHQNIGYILIRGLPFGIEFRLAAAFLIVASLAALLYWAVERRWERAVQRHSELLLGAGRRSLRLPPRPILKPSLPDEMRAW
ncbi:MAG TPA: acyltransferase [Sphingomicrobium sp.]|nr:acyltransferase [Sphingomicrobium sp.]